MKKIAWITNVCPEYRIHLYEKLSKVAKIDFYFIDSLEGKNKYGSFGQKFRSNGRFRRIDLKGISITQGTRFNPSLFFRLIRKNYDILVCNFPGNGFDLLTAYVYSRIFNKKLILNVEEWHCMLTRVRQLTNPLLNLILKRADYCLCYGRKVLDYLSEKEIKKDKLIWVPNVSGILRSIKTIKNKRKLQKIKELTKETKIVLFLGRLIEVKGLINLLESFKEIQSKKIVNCSLIIAGDGPLRKELESYVIKNRLEKVYFIGAVSNEKYSYYKLCDLFILPSKITPRGDNEAWGLVVNEAMQVGKPVLISEEAGCSKDLVINGKNGYSYNPRSEEIIEKIKILNDKDKLKKMGQNSRILIKKFSDEEFINIFKREIIK